MATTDIIIMTESYRKKIYNEMLKRGFDPADVQKVIDKTGFEEALRLYPEEQMHYSISDAVDEILLVAAGR